MSGKPLADRAECAQLLLEVRSVPRPVVEPYLSHERRILHLLQKRLESRVSQTGNPPRMQAQADARGRGFGQQRTLLFIAMRIDPAGEQPLPPLGVALRHLQRVLRTGQVTVHVAEHG